MLTSRTAPTASAVDSYLINEVAFFQKKFLSDKSKFLEIGHWITRIQKALAKFFHDYLGQRNQQNPRNFIHMFRELRTLHSGEPACQKRSDSDHLRFVIHRKETDEDLKFDFAIELNGIKSWAVPDVPSMNPLDQRHAMQDEIEATNILETLDHPLTEEDLQAWDKGNYIPIDDNGNVLSEYEALESLQEGSLKFFLQGRKLVGEFVLMRNGPNNWLLMKRHDEFALYTYYSYEAVGS
jgi:DNA polymerase ligase (LigD)-like protein